MSRRSRKLSDAHDALCKKMIKAIVEDMFTMWNDDREIIYLCFTPSPAINGRILKRVSYKVKELTSAVVSWKTNPGGKLCAMVETKIAHPSGTLQESAGLRSENKQVEAH